MTVDTYFFVNENHNIAITFCADSYTVPLPFTNFNHKRE